MNYPQDNLLILLFVALFLIVYIISQNDSGKKKEQIHKNISLSLKKIDLLVSRQFLYNTNKFIKVFNIDSSKVNYIGLSGQTIIHKPHFTKYKS